MANHFSHACLPYIIKNARYTIAVPYLDADGDPTDPTTPDTEFSGDAGSFADCAEEVTTITGSNGVGYITLSGAETNYSMLAVVAKVASGPKNTVLTTNIRNLPIVSNGTLSAGSAGGGTLGTILAYDITGCFIRTTGGTGGGGTGGANNQARKLATYTQSTGAFTVIPNWETTPSTDTTYDILLPDGAVFGALKALNAATAGRTVVVDANGLVDANTVKLGPTGSGTAQTAKDVGAAVPAAAAGASGGLLISGPNSGTTTLAALTITGVTTHTGNVVLSDGLTISAPSTTNRAGLDVAGNGTGAALKLVAGVTGIGFSVAGGATSGDGIKVVTTSGHGVNLAPVGTSMHGLLSTGGNGGTSDGIKAAAGTGGVDFRANQTGNLTGTVATLTTYTGNTPQTGDAYARLGAPAGASVSADIAAVQSDTDNIQTRIPAALISGRMDSNTQVIATGAVDANALAADAANEIADALLDRAAGVETGLTLRQAHRLLAASLAGKLSGAATTTVVIRNAIADSKDRITATVDADGNRSAITVDLT